ncbi:MAG: glutathione peroxidase [Arenicellales bacterium]|jgi:glutathione peroxidase|nr:glutathione peroxidase [Arenicellales bacterium]
MRINYTTQVTRIDGTEADLSDYSGQVLLIVNTASACGYTPQYRGLQALYQRFKDQGFSVLGFPCNQFGGQEPGPADEIRDFCEQKFSVTFPLFAKIDVNGTGTHPLYQQLKSAKPGLLGSQDIKWNFTKFLVSRDGEVQERYGSQKDPNDLEPAVLEALGEGGTGH